ncbi:MAG: hypothetical protein IT204_00760 [Fimbriimonadaceae bacterium]|nr:hypothetical protein [Fimbriimonadaceae bacterium]
MNADTLRFLDRLRAGEGCLDRTRPVLVARAPGRLDAFGGVIDYTGGTVCEMPLAVATHVALQARTDRTLRLTSLGVAAHGLQETVSLDLNQLVPPAGPRPYDAVRAELAADPTTAWAAYVAGAWLVLARERYVDQYLHGVDLVIDSAVPVGAGVSSSAAIEVATLYALTRLHGLSIAGQRLARLGQMVENLVVGAPCGLMDQLTVALGRQDALLLIRCQPDDILGHGAVPPGVCLGALHTGVKHAVGGSHYTDARVAAFMGHAVILDYLRQLGSIGAAEDPFDGYLARIPADEYLTTYRHLLPAQLDGAAFLERYGGTVDTATHVDPATTYAVATAVKHQVLDNSRAPRFVDALAAYGRTRQPVFLERAGEYLLQAHAGYRDDLNLGAPEADLMLELALRRGPAAGVYGGRITGGGCGGSVVFLGDERLPALLPSLAAEYEERSGRRALILTGSSDGAEAVGVAEVNL